MAVGRRIAPGDVVAGYEIKSLVGRGGMGDVHLALDTRLERPVALKVLGERFSDDDGFRDRLLRESRLAASLDHPNVVPIYEAGEADGRLFIAMRYVDGTDLKALMRREGALEPKRALAVASQVAEALDAAHAKGLVHRDVKPSNVLLDLQGGREHAYLADFGLTQSVSDRGPTDGQLMGTVDYVAPEQIRGDEIDGRADVYALGCLVFEALTGGLPFEGGSDVAVIYAHLEDERPNASQRRPELPAAVDDVLTRAMAKDRDDRPATCGELVQQVRSALGLDLAGPPPRRRLLALVVGLCVACMAAVAAIVAIATRNDEGAAPVSGGALVRIDPSSKSATASYPVSAHPGPLTVAANRVWLGDFRDGSLWRIDPTRGDVQRFTTTGEPRDLTTLGDRVYVAGDATTIFESTITRYDAVTGTREAAAKVLACSLTAGDGVLWVAGCPYIVRLSPLGEQMKVLATTLVPFQEPLTAENVRVAMRDLAIGAGVLWIVGDPVDRRLFRADEHTGRILSATTVPFAPRSIAFGAGGVWVTGPMDDVVGRFDPRTGRLTDVIHVGRGASGIAAGGGSVWVATALDRAVNRIDPETRSVVDRIPVEGAPRELAYGAGALWVTVDAG
jgi:streptogramin lyase